MNPCLLTQCKVRLKKNLIILFNYEHMLLLNDFNKRVHHKDIFTTSIGAQVIGGCLFGIGWGLLGYCPGTAAGAFGEGKIDALWGMLGMLCGGALYAVVYPLVKTHIIAIGSFGKISLPAILGINHWIAIIVLALLTLLLFRFLESKNL
jgi:uncharacterized membrane protein YedE/YeeE